MNLTSENINITGADMRKAAESMMKKESERRREYIGARGW